MKKNLDTNKLLIGLKKDFTKDTGQLNDIDKAVSRIHSADEKEKNEITNRTTIDIPKELHKRIRLRVADKELTMKDYFLGLAKKDLELQ